MFACWGLPNPLSSDCYFGRIRIGMGTWYSVPSSTERRIICQSPIPISTGNFKTTSIKPIGFRIQFSYRQFKVPSRSDKEHSQLLRSSDMEATINDDGVSCSRFKSLISVGAGNSCTQGPFSSLSACTSDGTGLAASSNDMVDQADGPPCRHVRACISTTPGDNADGTSTCGR
jgi:hypothetical protein